MEVILDRPPDDGSPSGVTWAAPAAMAAVALGAALALWLRYLPSWRHLWTDLIHDRNAHLEFGLGLAGDLRHLRWYELARDVDSARTWPPLHDGAMVGLAMLLSGFDVRMAVLPSLLSYAGTAVLAFLLARRLVVRGGSVAGVVAALFVLVSPAGRAFATDVMIEGPGACLTLLALYAAIQVEQRGAPREWTVLALSLSALFFVKYNYWLLVAASLAPLLWRAWPLPRPARRALLWWHLLPAAVWLAMPGKLGRFAWVLWPGTNGGEFPTSDRLAGFRYYARAAAQDYHLGVWSAIAVAVMVLGAVAGWASGRLRAGSGTLLLFLVLAAMATVPHPNRKSRFLHSWMPVVWVLAGAGLGWLVGERRREARWTAALVGALLVGAEAPGLLAPPHAPEGGVRLDVPSTLDLTDAYLPYLANARHPAVLGAVPLRYLAGWTYLERYGRAERVSPGPRGFDVAETNERNAAVFGEWLASGPVDVIVYVDVPASSGWHQRVPDTAGLLQMGRLMERQTALHEVARFRVPAGDGTIVTVWRR